MGCGEDGTEDELGVIPGTTPAATTPASPVDKECDDILHGTPEENTRIVPSPEKYAEGLKNLDIAQVKLDMEKLLRESNDCWPADGGSYGALMIRLAWHCSGTYREDGNNKMGGCTGGRLLYEPERSWPDNTNLDKARALLYPLKKKYGDALSWGDLMILAGTTALRQYGMPLKRMCFGRVDEADGTRSLVLGPTALQEEKYPCQKNGECKAPLPTTVGLIYVNPEGPMGNASNLAGSAAEIRSVFKIMGHNDRSSVALIGGGHAIGKAHGACQGAPGLSPVEAFAKNESIWKGSCGNGKGENTFTSGFEGHWTSQPQKWDNEFFKDLVGKKWVLDSSPAGQGQYVMDESEKDKYRRIRLTTDMALLYDEDYKQIVEEFAHETHGQSRLNEAFDIAWDALTITKHTGQWSSEAICDDNSTAPTSVTTMRDDDVNISNSSYDVNISKSSDEVNISNGSILV